LNKATKLNVAVFGSIFGISGINHGFFEILQGNKLTPGLFVMAIGEAQKMWLHGNEPALTIIPNFMISGVLSVFIGGLIILWSIKFVHLKYGPIILFILFTILLLVGGGIAQIIFFPWICLVASRINKTPIISIMKLPLNIQQLFSNIWPFLLSISGFILVFALFVATTGFIPGISNPEIIMFIMLCSLVIDLVLIALTYFSGFVRDAILKKV